MGKRIVVVVVVAVVVDDSEVDLVVGLIVDVRVTGVDSDNWKELEIE